MIKRGNASKRAKAELFSNETEYEEVVVADEGALKRERLRREMLGKSAEEASVSARPEEAQTADSAPRTAPSAKDAPAFPKRPAPAPGTRMRRPVQTGSVPRVHTGSIPKVQTRSIPRVPTGSIPKVQTGSIPRVQTGSIPKVQTGSIPRVQTGSVPKVRPSAPHDRVRTATYPRVGAAPRRNNADTAKYAPVGQRRRDADDAPTRQIGAVKTAVPAKKNRRGAKIAAACLALLLISGALITVLALTGKKEVKAAPVVVPADVVAGTEETEETVISPSTGAEHPKVLRHNVKFTFYDKPELICNTPEVKAGELMKSLGIDYQTDKILNIDESSPINCDCNIDIKTVTHTVEYETEQIPYDTEYEDDSSMFQGEEEVKQYGSEGVKTYTYDCTYVNGELESRVLSAEEVTKEPVNCIIGRGTAIYTPPAPVTPVSGGDGFPQTVYSGAPTEYLYYIDVRATCYNIIGTTATGMPTGHNVMAVDPSVIPLGSTCVVIGELGDYGVRVAADVGGGIKGNIIDIWVPPGSEFGVQNCRVYVLHEGWD